MYTRHVRACTTPVSDDRSLIAGASVHRPDPGDPGTNGRTNVRLYTLFDFWKIVSSPEFLFKLKGEGSHHIKLEVTVPVSKTFLSSVVNVESVDSSFPVGWELP